MPGKIAPLNVRAQAVSAGVQYLDETNIAYMAAATADYTVTTEEDVMATSSAVRQVSLPALATIFVGRRVLVKDAHGGADKNPISVVPASGDLIDGSSAPYLIAASYGFVSLIAASGGWRQVTPAAAQTTEEQRFLLADSETALDEAWQGVDLVGLS